MAWGNWLHTLRFMKSCCLYLYTRPCLWVTSMPLSQVYPNLGEWESSQEILPFLTGFMKVGGKLAETGHCSTPTGGKGAVKEILLLLATKKAALQAGKHLKYQKQFTSDRLQSLREAGFVTMLELFMCKSVGKKTHLLSAIVYKL